MRFPLKSLFLSVSMVVFYHVCFSQSDTLNLKDPKPFDKPFTLKWNVGKHANVFSASLFGIDAKGCFEPASLCTAYHNPTRSYPIQVNYDTSTGYAYLNMPALVPNRRYFITVNTIAKVDSIDAVIAKLDAGADTISGRATDSAAAEQLYTAIQNKPVFIFKRQDPYVCSTCGNDTFFISPFPLFLSFYQKTLLPLRKIILRDKGKMNIFQKDSVAKVKLGIPSPIKPDPKYIMDNINYGLECNRCKDSVRMAQWIMGNKSGLFYTEVINLMHLQDTLLCYGYTDLDSFAFALNTDTLDVDKKVANLKTTITAIGQLLQLFDFYDETHGSLTPAALAYKTSIENALSVLKDNYHALYVYSASMDKLDKEIKKIKDSTSTLLAKWPGFLAPLGYLSDNTFNYDFSTRSGFVIKPDFGFLVYGNPWSNKNFVGVSPFLGFHINFRPYNTDISHRSIKEELKPLDYFSFTAGALLVSLTDSGKTKGLVGNTAIFTGLGWSPGYAVRVSAGSLWFRKINPNPLITSTSVAATPFIALSIDLRLKDIYSSFAKIFP